MEKLPELSQEVVNQIREAAPPKGDLEKIGRAEERALEKRLRSEQIRSFSQDIDERKKYASKSFSIMAAWISGVFLILLLQGFLSERVQFFGAGVSFKLSDAVLLAVVSGTTASIIGIFVVVANYLFPKR